MNKTTGIIAIVLTSLLCGLPGLALAVAGLLAALGIATTGAPAAEFNNTLLGAALFLCGGTLLIAIPIVVGVLTMRKRRPAPAQTHAPSIEPGHTAPVSPSTAQPARAEPQPAAPPLSTGQPPAMPPASPSDAPNPSQEIYARLMALNRPTAPYQIVDGRAEGVDLIAEWKIVDARWYEVFAKAGLTKVFRIYLKLDPAKREVRAQDHEYTVSWRAGAPSLSLAASSFRGQMTSVEFGAAVAFTEEVAPGVVYKYRFNTNELKKPIQEAAAACGWKYKGVAFGRL